MVKADDRVEYENEQGETIKEKFTNFDLLLERVNVLQEQVNNITEVLRDNELYKKYQVDLIEGTEAFTRLKEEPQKE